MLTPTYSAIKDGQNKLTARFSCSNNPSLTSHYSVNVTGVANSNTAIGAPVPTHASTANLNNSNNNNHNHSHSVHSPRRVVSQFIIVLTAPRVSIPRRRVG